MVADANKLMPTVAKSLVLERDAVAQGYLVHELLMSGPFTKAKSAVRTVAVALP